jgi:hypothetical protein
MFGFSRTSRPRKVKAPPRIRLTYGTSGKLAASSTFSLSLLHLRNIGCAEAPSTHSNAEILPPTEGFSDNRNGPQVNVGRSTSEGFLSKLFTSRQLRWG